MTDGVGERLLRDAEDLAFDAIAESREFVELHVDRHCRRALSKLRKPFDRLADVFNGADVGTERADRTTCFRQMRACQIDRVLDVARDGWRHRAGLALRSLQLHQDRGESLRQVVVNIAREAIAFLEDRLTSLFDA